MMMSDDAQHTMLLNCEMASFDYRALRRQLGGTDRCSRVEKRYTEFINLLRDPSQLIFDGKGGETGKAKN